MGIRGMRVSLICLLLLVEAWISHHGVLASPYHHKYGNQDEGTVFSGSSKPYKQSGYAKPGQQFHSQPSLANHYTSSKGFNRDPVKVSTVTQGSYGTALHRPPITPFSGYGKPSMTSLKGNDPQLNSKAMKKVFAPERGLFRSEPGGFFQNAPGSLFTGHPLENEVSVPTVYKPTVPYYAVNNMHPGMSASEPVVRQPTQHQDSFNTIIEGTPHSGYYQHGFPNAIQLDAHGGGQQPQADPVFSSLPGQSPASWYSGGQSTNFQSDWNHPIPTHFSAPGLISGENEAITGEGPDQPLQPPTYVPSQTMESVAVSPHLGTHVIASRGNGRDENDTPYSERRIGATADGKPSKKFKTKTRYLVRAFNQYEKGRLYLSHGSNDPKEMKFPFPGDNLKLQIQDEEYPGSKEYGSDQ